MENLKARFGPQNSAARRCGFVPGRHGTDQALKVGAEGTATDGMDGEMGKEDQQKTVVCPLLFQEAGLAVIAALNQMKGNAR